MDIRISADPQNFQRQQVLDNGTKQSSLIKKIGKVAISIFIGSAVIGLTAIGLAFTSIAIPFTISAIIIPFPENNTIF